MQLHTRGKSVWPPIHIIYLIFQVIWAELRATLGPAGFDVTYGVGVKIDG